MKRILYGLLLGGIGLTLTSCDTWNPFARAGDTRCTTDNRIKMRDMMGLWRIVDDCSMYEPKQHCIMKYPSNPYKRFAMCEDAKDIVNDFYDGRN